MGMKNKLLLTIIICISFLDVTAQHSITKMDFVKIKNGKQKEALFFYENNWKVYRDIALEKGYIKSYKLVTTLADSIANFDLILITEYADSLQEKLSEERFQLIIKEKSPNGPKLLNDLKPNDFRQNLFLKEVKTLYSGNSKPPLSNLNSLYLKWKKYTLLNCIQVLLQQDTTQKETVVEFWVHAGTGDEQKGKYGLAHFFEHCTPFTSDTALLKFVRAIRTNSNTQTRKDYLRYYVQIKPDGLASVVKYMADRIKANKDTLSNAVTEHERVRVLSEMHRQELSPFYGPLATSARDAATFGIRHPYGHSGYGTIQENQQFNTEDIKNWFQKYFFTNNIIVFVTGNFKTAIAKNIIDREFAVIPKRGIRQEKKYQLPKTLPAKLSITVPIPNHFLSVSWAVPGYGNKDIPALGVLSEVLQQRLASHIYGGVEKLVLMNYTMYMNGQVSLAYMFLSKK
jgi:hypothetical protein